MDQDQSPLGRGLESLIPPRSGGDKPSASGPDPAGHPPDPAAPVRHPEPEAPAEPAPVPSETHTPPAPLEEPTAVPSQPAPAGTDAAPVTHVQPMIHARPERDRHAHKQYDAVFHLEVEKIKPNPEQPRRTFDETALRDLAASIREFGLLQPVVVTKIEREVPTGTEVEYYLISGERRLMAVKLLGFERVPALIRNVDLDRERLELAVIENIQRENLNPMETARAMSRLQDEFRLTQREIASRLGKSREVIANTVRLLDLPPYIQEALEQGRVSESHGRLLLTIEEPAIQERLFREIVERGMTTRELKNKVEAARPKQASLLKTNAELSPELKALQERISSGLGAPVKIQQEGESGKITISFYSEEELRSIADKLGAKEEGF